MSRSIGGLADLGWEVDYSAADEFTLTIGLSKFASLRSRQEMRRLHKAEIE